MINDKLLMAALTHIQGTARGHHLACDEFAGSAQQRKFRQMCKATAFTLDESVEHIVPGFVSIYACLVRQKDRDTHTSAQKGRRF